MSGWALTFRETEVQLEEPARPEGLVLAGHAALPLPQIQTSLWCSGRLREEAERVITAPLLPARMKSENPCCFSLVEIHVRSDPPLFLQSVLAERHIYSE